MAKNWKNSTLSERIEYVLKEMEWTEAELTRQIDAAGQSTVQQWRTGRNKTMQSRFAWPLQDKHRWNARWLLDGEGDPRLAYVEPERQQLIERVGALPADRLKALVAFISG
jgi:hypothetical protein